MNQVSQEVFRAYDIRGVVGEQLNPTFFHLLGRAYGTIMQDQQLSSIVIGYDGRLSSKELAAGLIDGLLQSGLKVTSIGRVPTPCLYYAVSHLNMDGGIMITGSHNPSQYNGCKMMMAGNTLALEDIQALYHQMTKGQFKSAEGSHSEIDFLSTYLDALTSNVVLNRSYKLVLDCGNGVAGVCASPMLKRLGIDPIELYCEVDGTFPNHHPDPGNPANLVALQNEINKEKADLGYAFDGDGDRVGLVSNKGQIIYPDRVLILLAEDLLSRHPGATIIYDVKCSYLLPQYIRKSGGHPMMWKTGHSLIKRKMKETGALLGGEMSGHIFFAEDWFGSDDALLAAVRLLQILDASNLTVEEIFARYPHTFSTPEINIPTADEQHKFMIIEQLTKQGDFKANNISTIDGLRVEYDGGWGLVRASNTNPVLVLRFEAEDQQTLQNIEDIFRQQLHRVAPKLSLEF